MGFHGTPLPGALTSARVREEFDLTCLVGHIVIHSESCPCVDRGQLSCISGMFSCLV